MIKIAILNKDDFYSKLLASKLAKAFPGKLKRVTSFNSINNVTEHLAKIVTFDLIIIGDGVCADYPQLLKILNCKKCIANSKRFYLNKIMLDNGADWVIDKNTVFNSYSTFNVNPMAAWVKVISDWFF